ncbi:MAG: arginine--tRNA ligase [Candidatus Woesearchaeota archaeon]
MINFKEEIIFLLSEIDILNEQINLEIPKEISHGDFAFPCFILSKKLKKNPFDLSKEISNKLNEINNKKNNSIIEKVENNGAYVNFFIKKNIKAKEIINSIINQSYFKFDKKNEKIMVEYSQVNTHKAFHVGHIRGTLLGSVLINLLKYYGYEVVSANYQGDTGAHVAKSLWYLKKHLNESFPNKRKGIWLGNIYKKANKLLDNEENNEKYKKEISKILQQLENRDKELTELWKITRKYSLDDFEEIYNLLGVSFDNYFFESEMEEKGKNIVNELLNKKIAYYDDKAVVINLEKYDLGVFVLLKSDGTTLYSTKDLALANIKFNDFKIDKSLYVVGSEQKYHFQQLFKTLEIMGFKQAKYCKHIPYDLVNLEGGKISSREGELILAIDFIEEIKNNALIEVKKRDNVENSEETAKDIALSAIRFGFLNYDNNKSIIFNMKKALDFEGETGPYIQYSYARISSILNKLNIDVDEFINNINSIDYSLLNEDIESELISKLMNFRDVIIYCSENYKINLLCRYLIELSQLFNEFYHKCNIIKEKEELKKARLALIISVQKVLFEGLSIIGIKSLNKM